MTGCLGEASALGQMKLAREAGLANNTVAAGWIEMFSDLFRVGASAAWDASKRAGMARKPAKYPFVNLLPATVWSPDAPRTPDDLEHRRRSDARSRRASGGGQEDHTRHGDRRRQSVGLPERDLRAVGRVREAGQRDGCPDARVERVDLFGYENGEPGSTRARPLSIRRGIR